MADVCNSKRSADKSDEEIVNNLEQIRTFMVNGNIYIETETLKHLPPQQLLQVFSDSYADPGFDGVTYACKFEHGCPVKFSGEMGNKRPQALMHGHLVHHVESLHKDSLVKAPNDLQLKKSQIVLKAVKVKRNVTPPRNTDLQNSEERKINKTVTRKKNYNQICGHAVDHTYSLPRGFIPMKAQDFTYKVPQQFKLHNLEKVTKPSNGFIRFSDKVLDFMTSEALGDPQQNTRTSEYHSGVVCNTAEVPRNGGNARYRSFSPPKRPTPSTNASKGRSSRGKGSRSQEPPPPENYSSENCYLAKLIKDVDLESPTKENVNKYQSEDFSKDNYAPLINVSNVWNTFKIVVE